MLAAGTVTATGGAAEAKPRPAVAWDFDGDGIRDLVAGIPTFRFPDDTNSAGRGAIAVLKGGRGGLSSPRIITGPASVNTGGLWQGFGRVLASGDFDADGRADLAVGGIDDKAGRGSVYLFRGTATGLGAQPVVLHGPRKAAWSKFGFAIAAGDFDHDGYADLYSAEVFGGRSWVYRGGRGFWKSRKRSALPRGDAKAYVNSAAAGDFNGDGRDDLVLNWYRRKDMQTRSPGRISVLPGSSKGLRRPVTVATKQATGLLAVGDLSGDRRAEIALATENNTRIVIWRGTRKGFAKAARPVARSVRPGTAGALSIGGGLLAVGRPDAERIDVLALTGTTLTLRGTHHPLGIVPGHGYGTSVVLRDFTGDRGPEVAGGIPLHGYAYSPGGQVVAVHRALDISPVSGALPQQQFPLPDLTGGSLSQIVLG
ncbi:hypothetical protein GCM10010468_43780 [Actinocorallia longicatena]|uniref:FG-GAP repeat protein n=1 Tax=Actinocorallia longicatena TaxID=111803 RepID=A0ABP6QCF7_9ACTN